MVAHGGSGKRLLVAAVAAVALLVLAVHPLVLWSAEAQGVVWTRVSLRLLGYRFSTATGQVDGLLIYYTRCGPLGCGGEKTALLPLRRGEAVELGWALVSNMAAELSTGDALPATALTAPRRGLLNASWSYFMVSGWALLRLEEGVPRVLVKGGCPRGFRVVWRNSTACVAEPPRPGGLVLSYRVEPLYGLSGGVRVEALPGPLLRLAFAAAACIAALYVLYAVRRGGG